MTTNHSTTPATPGLSAIEQIVADLSDRHKSEERRESELDALHKESLARKNSLSAAIALLMQEYKLPDPYGNKPDPINPKDGKLVGTKEWERPDNVSWLDLVRNAIKSTDELMTNVDIMDYLQMDSAARSKYKQTLSGSMATYRDSGQLIGIQTYYRTQKGSAFSQYFTGIPSFFQDAESKKLKPEYEAKFRDKLRQRDLLLAEEKAAMGT